MRIFIVVAKSRPDLYQYFEAGFAGVEGVEVILDRRIGPDVPPELSGDDSPRNRRTAGTVYDELEQRGFVIVRLPA